MTIFDDVLAVEEPLEIRIGFAVNGRTSTSDLDHDANARRRCRTCGRVFFLQKASFTVADQIKQIRHCGLKIGKQRERYRRAPLRSIHNTIRVDLNEGVEVDLKSLERNFYTTSSCGVCGKTSIEALQPGVKRSKADDYPKIDASVIHQPAGNLAGIARMF